MTDHEPDPIAAAAIRYKRADDAAKKARTALSELVLEALRAPDAKPVDIARRASWTPAYVRKLARDNDITAADDYQARTEKARARLLAEAVHERTEPIADQQPAAPSPFPAYVRKLHPDDAAHLAQVARERAPERAAHFDHIAQDAGQFGDYAVVQIALEHGALRNSDLDN